MTALAFPLIAVALLALVELRERAEIRRVIARQNRRALLARVGLPWRPAR